MPGIAFLKVMEWWHGQICFPIDRLAEMWSGCKGEKRPGPTGLCVSQVLCSQKCFQACGSIATGEATSQKDLSGR